MRLLLLSLYFIPVLCLAQNTFLEQCLSRVHLEENKPQETCQRINEHFFKDKKRDPQSLDPHQVGAPTFPSDSQTRILIIQNPQQFVAYGYCYFQFKNWFDPKKFSRDDFAMRVSGMAALPDELTGYDKWLQSIAGRRCAHQLKKDTGIAASKLKDILAVKKALVLLNPVAAANVTSSFDDIMRELWLTLNHERIHVLQSLCPDFAQKTHAEWTELSPEEKKAFAETNGSYNWDKESVALREYWALKNEHKPTHILETASTCKF